MDQVATAKNESRDAAIANIKKSMRQLPQGRAIAVDATLVGNEGTQLQVRLVSAYAPSDAKDRPAFMKSLRQILNKKSILGIDANCVPDIQLDVDSSAAAPG